MWNEIQTKAKYVLLQSIFMAKIAMADESSTTTSLDEVTADTFISEGPPSNTVLQRWECIFDIYDSNGFIWEKKENIASSLLNKALDNIQCKNEQ